MRLNAGQKPLPRLLPLKKGETGPQRRRAPGARIVSTHDKETASPQRANSGGYSRPGFSPGRRSHFHRKVAIRVHLNAGVCRHRARILPQSMHRFGQNGIGNGEVRKMRTARTIAAHPQRPERFQSLSSHRKHRESTTCVHES